MELEHEELAPYQDEFAEIESLLKEHGKVEDEEELETALFE